MGVEIRIPSTPDARSDPAAPTDGPGTGGAGPSVRACGAELVGTFVLVLAITTTASAAGLARPLAGAGFGSLAVALVNGLALAVVVASFGHVSGAHVNPAVTVALAAVRRFPARWVPAYVAAQLLGASVAAFVTWGIGGAAARGAPHLGANAVSPGATAGQAFLAEVVATFVLVLVVVAVTTDRRAPEGLAPLLIGAALAVAVFVAGPVDGAAVNPARALGPMFVSGTGADWWVFVAGPLVGGLLGAVTYRAVLSRGAPPETVLARTDA